MKKIKTFLSKQENSKLKNLGSKVNGAAYILWAAWLSLIPLIWTDANACVNTSYNWKCTLTPESQVIKDLNLNFNWHFSSVVTCQTNDCWASCNVNISEILNWPLQNSYECTYHVNHTSSWDSGSWDSGSWDSWDGGW